MPQPFAHPFMYWVGMDTDPRTTPEALAEFNQFYNSTHVHEVIAAHAGFVGVSRWELVEPDPRGGNHVGPRWLAIYDMQDEASAEEYIKDNARPWLHRRKYSPWPAARRKAKTVWRMLWRTQATAEVASDELYFVGTNQALSDFAATRLELYRAFAHPEPECPKFCVISEHATPDESAVWRLRYRRIL
ncbi:MAG: hypothetical protein JOZ81_22360 [Chloroflexi bacterium]|nr:hypothetical protein [Chloroflexota bacterium]